MLLRDRDELISLLERLGSAEDAVALAAAREIDARLKRDGLAWDALLARAGDDDDGAPGHVHASPDDDDAPAGGAAAGDAPVGDAPVGDAPVGDAAADIAAIDRLLAAKDLSPDTREMLDDLKEDIKAGAFTEADRRYVRSLEIRLAAAAKRK